MMQKKDRSLHLYEDEALKKEKNVTNSRPKEDEDPGRLDQRNEIINDAHTMLKGKLLRDSRIQQEADT